MNSQVYFENIREHIGEELKRSKESILLAVAWFTDSYLAKILIDKAQSNVDVKVLLVADDINKSENGVDFEALEINGVEIVWVKPEQYGLMHHEFCLIDSIACITGSYNWTSKAAKQNLENIIISHDRKLIDEYSNQFSQLYNRFNETISINDVFRRLKILKAMLLDGSKEEILEYSIKVKELLKSNIKNTKHAKKKLLSLLESINNSENFNSIKTIDAFLSTDWTITQEEPKHLLIPFRKDDKWGLRDKFKNITIDVKFDKVWTVTENLITVEQNAKWGCIDRFGKTIIPIEFDSVTYLKDGIVCLRKDTRIHIDFYTQLNKHYGLFNFKGKQITPFKYESIPRISEGRIIVEEGMKMGILDYNGKEIVPCRYHFISNFKDGYADFKKDSGGLEGFIDKEGKEIIPPKYEVACNFGEGLKRVKTNDKWIVIDLKEKVVIPSIYEHISELKDGLAAVLSEVPCLSVDKNYKVVKVNASKYGFIDKNNKVIIPIKYDEVKDFRNGLAIVKKHNKWGVLDKTGSEVIPFKYDLIRSEDEIGFEVYLEQKRGYINRYNQEIIPIKYDQICKYAHGLVEVRIDKKWGVVNANGNVVIPINYDFEDKKSFEDKLEKVLYNGYYYLHDDLEQAVNNF